MSCGLRNVPHLSVQIPLLVEEGDAIQGLVRSNFSDPGGRRLRGATTIVRSFLTMHGHTHAHTHTHTHTDSPPPHTCYISTSHITHLSIPTAPSLPSHCLARAGSPPASFFFPRCIMMLFMSLSVSCSRLSWPAAMLLRRYMALHHNTHVVSG